MNFILPASVYSNFKGKYKVITPGMETILGFLLLLLLLLFLSFWFFVCLFVLFVCLFVFKQACLAKFTDAN